jgi:hypothetical protein
MKQKSLPNITNILEILKKDIFYNFNCHRVGIIQSFNSEDQTARIQLVDKRVFEIIENNEAREILKDYSLLVDCPIMILGAGGRGRVTVPIDQGASCLVLFNDRDIDNWFEAGAVQKPNSPRAHDLSDGIAFVGINSLLSSIAGYNNDAAEIIFENTKISLDEKIGIENADHSIKDLIDELIDIIINLKVIDPISGELPIDAATSTALTTLLTKFSELLK